MSTISSGCMNAANSTAPRSSEVIGMLQACFAQTEVLTPTPTQAFNSEKTVCGL